MKHFNFLTIAGSDSGGGAGIQADIKTATMLGGYASSVITALTSQNTSQVLSIFPASAEFVADQLQAVLSDISFDVIKSGMLLNAEIIDVISNYLPKQVPYILDPVMISKSGAKLLNDNAIQKLIDKLVCCSYVLTPNLPEMIVLCGDTTVKSAQEFLQNHGGEYLLIKGGHAQEEMVTDILVSKKDSQHITLPRIHTKAGHGTGCTMASALASFIAQGHQINDAVVLAKNYVYEALKNADTTIGKGSNPLKHNFILKEFP